MIVFDGLELIGLAIMAVALVICGIILVIDRIACGVTNLRNGGMPNDSQAMVSAWAWD